MEILKEIFANYVLLVPIASWIISQIIKMVINFVVYKKFSLERLLGDGGMPSAHSATVMCLMILVGWSAGFGSSIFALSFIFAVVVMRDAIGVRRETGKQAASIKQLADAVNSIFHTPDSKIKTEKLKLLVGHTPLQVFCGVIIGAAVAVLYILLFLL